MVFPAKKKPKQGGLGDRQGAILSRLKGQILSGALPPGTLLPSRRALAARHRTTVTTIQKALGRLQRMGFVQSRGWAGSTVAEHPPHLFHYGLLLPDAPTGRDQWYWSRFLTGLAAVVHQRGCLSPRRFTVYSNLLDWDHSDDARQLEADLSDRRLAGLILAGDPGGPARALLRQADKAGIRAVAVGRIDVLDHLPTVELDQQLLMDAALNCLRKKNCLRASMVLFNRLPGVYEAAAEKQLRKTGMSVGPTTFAAFDPRFPSWVRSWTSRVFSQPRRQRPDGLFVQDDNLLPPVTEALAELKLRPGRDLVLVAHANYPGALDAPAGTLQVGWDLGHAIAEAVEMLARTSGDSATPNIQLPLVWRNGDVHE